MPYFDVEQYEVHAQTFRVKAANPADAIARVRNGEGDTQDNAPDYIEVCDVMGRRVDELAVRLELPAEEFLEQCKAADVQLADTDNGVGALIESIRDVCLSEDQEDQGDDA